MNNKFAKFSIFAVQRNIFFYKHDQYLHNYFNYVRKYGSIEKDN